MVNASEGLSIAVIVPTLNDASNLESLLEHLLLQWDPVDICVSDGGSQDHTAAVAAKSGVALVHAPRPGRARQMNRGARALERYAYWFLHADAIPPLDARESIGKALASGCVGGAFSRRFDSPSSALRATCRLADWRGRLWGWFLGDQGIFVRRDLFWQLGGFPNIDVFEDLEFSRRMAQVGKVALLRPSLRTSARRFARKGPWQQTAIDFCLSLKYLGSPSPASPSKPFVT